jgi:iron complex outermembrane receptor protein
MHSDVRHQRLGLRALTFLSLAATVLLCSPEKATAQAPSDSVPRYQLDSIVVSVLGAPVRVGESAYPISVVGRADLREGKSGMFLEEALQSLPGVQVQNRFNYAVGERISIRGFGSRAQFGVRGIHVVVDGIPATLPDGQSTLDHVDIGSLGRVEALRGPASALYGNASGGVLLFESEIAARTPLRQQATVVGGSDGLLRLQSITSGTVGGAGYLVSLDRLGYDGFRHFGTGGTTGASYGGATRTHLNARLVQQVAGGELGITLNQLDLESENPGSLNKAQIDADPNQIATIYDTFRTGKEVQQGQIGVTWRGSTGPYQTSAAVYGLSRDFSNPLPNDVADLDRRAGGGRLTVGRATMSGSTGFGLLTGVEYDFQDDDRREYTNSSGRPDVLQQNQNESVKRVGGFAQATLSFLDRVTLTGGARYDHASFEVVDLFPVTPGVNEDDSGRRDMNKLSPTVGAHVAVTPSIGVFANVATTFETPTTVELGNQENVSGGFNYQLEPMTGRTLEAGVRGTLQERVTFEVSVFGMQLENELLPFQNVDGLDFYRNVPKTARSGMDAIASARLFEFLSGQVSYTYTNATFEEATDRYGNDLADNKVPGLAPHQLQGSLRFSQGPWYLELGGEYVGEVAVNDRNCLVVLVSGACPSGQSGFTEAYTLFGVRLGGIAIRVGRLEISPFAGLQNSFDETYVSSVVPNAFAFSPNHTTVRFYEPGPGRTFYLGGSVAVSR